MIPQQACLNHTPNQVQVDTLSLQFQILRSGSTSAEQEEISQGDTEYNTTDKDAVMFLTVCHSAAKWD